jgi:peptidoglycan/LPS O-acetylase OafA/YrhL
MGPAERLNSWVRRPAAHTEDEAQMPKPIGRGRYIPGLDGLRAIAVAAVIAYHLGAAWAPGGVLGVAVFFTLSGYLITDLLLGDFDLAGCLRLKRFWLARARRLLPAFLAMLVVVVAWVTIFRPEDIPQLRGTAVAAVGYSTNWWLIAQNTSYFARFGPPDPLGHLWSLAVEEQFYLVWPWLLLLGLRIFRPRAAFSYARVRLAGVTLLLAAASAIAMAMLYSPGVDTTRIYDGTDTRAFGLLIGAALAMVWPSRQVGSKIARLRWHIPLDVIGVIGLAGIVMMIWRSNDYAPFLYRGGLVVLSFATVAVVAAVVHPQSWLGAALGWAPLRWLGVRSYALYLWHFPVIVLGAAHPGERPSLLRALVMTGVSVLLAAASWTWVEDPIRHGALKKLWGSLQSGAWLGRVSLSRVTVSVFSVTVLVVAGLGLSVKAAPVPAVATQAAAKTPLPPAATAPLSTPATSVPTTVPTTAPTSAPTGLATTPPATPAAATSSCTSVMHIGDSTSEGLTSPAYLPDPALRIGAQYADVGAKTVRTEISGGRSILERLPPEPNAQTVAQDIIKSGYHGCWVLALGTNDTANVYVGSVMDRAGRIKAMMSIIGKQPVMWTTVKSLLTGGAYAENEMQLWNRALQQACTSYPNMRVYDWASVVQDSWFGVDKVHFTSLGYAARSHGLAQGLAHAFPKHGSSPGCFVR